MPAITHSLLGGSGAHRWMECSGTVLMSQGIEDEESDFAIEGIAAHYLGEFCFKKHYEPWEFIGQYVLNGKHIYSDQALVEDYGSDIFSSYKQECEGYNLVKIDKEMADAVQYYINSIDQWHPDRHQGNSWVERQFKCPDIHEYFFGVSDFTYWDEETKTIHVWDYKHGAGIVVEAEWNPQGMYYAAGIIEDLGLWNEVERIFIHIIQPRAWHWSGPHRYWEVSPDELDEWLFDKCVPAMDKALVSTETKTGSHCRFCPARSAECPALMKDLDELKRLVRLMERKGADNLTPEQIGRILALKEVANIAFKAAAGTAYGMLNAGKEVPGVKLAEARTNREWKKGAETALKKQFGGQAFSKPTLKSPAQIDNLPGGKKLTARWAFKPKGKLTVTTEGDPRERVQRDAKSLFKKQPKEG